MKTTKLFERKIQIDFADPLADDLISMPSLVNALHLNPFYCEEMNAFIIERNKLIDKHHNPWYVSKWWIDANWLVSYLYQLEQDCLSRLKFEYLTLKDLFESYDRDTAFFITHEAVNANAVIYVEAIYY